MYNHNALLKDVHYFLTYMYVNNMHYQKISLPTPWLGRGDGEGSQKPIFCKRKTVWSYVQKLEFPEELEVVLEEKGGGGGDGSNQNSSLRGEAWIFCGTYKYDKV